MAAQKSSIMSKFPYPIPRSGQRELLEALERYWGQYDVFIITVPTAGGKTAIARTIAGWQGNTSIITPTNLLVQQFAREFPDTPTLYRKSMYICPRFGEGKLRCDEAAARFRRTVGCARDCQYKLDLRRARNKWIGAYNYWIYMAHKLYRPTLIIDEGHNVLPLIQDTASAKLWRHQYNYPADMWTYGDIVNWIEGEPEGGELLADLRDEITSLSPRYIIKRDMALWHGSERDVLKLIPIDVRDAPPIMWPSKVRKIVLMSATISSKDIEALGLDRRRCMYLEVDSPIPVASRPIIYTPVASVTRATQESATREIADYIMRELLPRHPDSKGVIHTTYSQAALLRNMLTGERFIFHDRGNVRQRFREYANSWEPVVLVACGLSEGIDLVGDLGRWQVVAKVPYPSLADPAVRYKAERDEAWYCWAALKPMIQACGRICRTPEDTGVTYILDSQFRRLYDRAVEFGLAPRWWRAAITWGD